MPEDNGMNERVFPEKSQTRVNSSGDKSAVSTFIVSEHGNPDFSGAISLCYCRFSVAAYADDLFQRHGIYCPPAIQASVEKRRAEFFAGRYCAKKSLRLLNNSVADVHIGKHRNPLWPAHIIGSISHSSRYAVAITALQSNIRGIGIDIQDEIDSDCYAKINRHTLFDREYDVIFKHSHALPVNQLFTLAFSVKESFFKAAFTEVGRYFDFSSIAITHINPQKKLISMRVNETLSERLTIGCELRAAYQILPDKQFMTLVILE
ncbi:4'-phosphopantetheinyl transferase [Cellvibrio sp. PSBB023]|uniref:4'-phosphopantetheinyl transferase family protein n=1 Tax=Cellvibrio sp. PSBB023 TaxID=1945512 RepID=UPI00098FB51D|nr:4'-phosphopantetheinyl transferase superfamily protein [Cellvibrio sp. PSBB023]